MLPILQRQLRQFEMSIRDGRHNDDIHLSVLHHLLRGPVAFDTRVVFLGIIARLWVALYDSIELEVGDDRDEGDMEDFGGHAIAYDADIEGFGRHGGAFAGDCWDEWSIGRWISQDLDLCEGFEWTHRDR